MRICTKCNSEKPLSCYHKKLGGFRTQCKVCTAAADRERREASPTDTKQIDQNRRAQKMYGVSGDEYRFAMATSDCCEICSSTLELCYDHCHDTMAFRGVLCRRCNKALGSLGDNEEGLARALEYLRK
jgi:hypothetical protein